MKLRRHTKTQVAINKMKMENYDNKVQQKDEERHTSTNFIGW